MIKFRVSSFQFPVSLFRMLILLAWVGLLVGCRHLASPPEPAASSDAPPPMPRGASSEAAAPSAALPKPEPARVRPLEGALFLGVATERGTGIIFSNERVDLSEQRPWSSGERVPCRSEEGIDVGKDFGCYQVNSAIWATDRRGHELEAQVFCPLSFLRGAKRSFPFGPSLTLLALSGERPVFEGELRRWGTVSTGETGGCELALEARVGTLLQPGTVFVARSGLDRPFPEQACPKIERFSFDESHPLVASVLSKLGRAEAFQGCHRVRVERIFWSHFQGMQVDYDGDGVMEDVLHFALEYEFSGNCRVETMLPSGARGKQWIYGLTGVGISSRLMTLEEGKWIDLLPPWDGTEGAFWRKYELIDWIDLENDGRLEVLTRNEYSEGSTYSLWRLPSSPNDLPLASTPYVNRN